MLSLETRLSPSEREVIGKVIDGEAILINLATGSYYALPDVGALIWDAIAAHCSLAEIAEQISAHYEVAPERARADVIALAGQLLDERMVTTSNETGARAAFPAPPANRAPYAPPKLTVYSDMRNLLALDPPMPMIDSLGGASESKRGSSGSNQR